MRCLVIETSGPACSVALVEDRTVVASRHELLGRGHAERLLPWIAGLPGGGRADEIVAGCGPGSFTGVRVAIAAARGLGLGWGVPVRGVSSLALIAAGIDQEEAVIALEGGHGELFVQAFSGRPLIGIGVPVSQAPAAAAHMFAPCAAFGSGAPRLVDAWGAGSAELAEPRADAFINTPAAALLPAATPIYGRGADARPSVQ